MTLQKRNLYRADGSVLPVVIEAPIPDLSVIAKLLGCDTVALIQTTYFSFLVDEDGHLKQLPTNWNVSNKVRQRIVGDALELHAGDMV